METALALAMSLVLWGSIAVSVAYVLWHRGYPPWLIAPIAWILGPLALVLLLLPARAAGGPPDARRSG